MKTLGKLKFHDGCWYMLLKPHVAVRAKRIFPRAAQDRAGIIALVDSAEVARDIEWMLERWPLEMSDADRHRLKLRADESRAVEEAVESILAGRTIPLGDDWTEPARPGRDYQTLAADMVWRTGRLLLGDEIGLGKTQSASMLFRDPRTLPALIVAPTHLPPQWQRELSIVMPHLRTHIIKSTTPYPVDTDVLVTSYSKLRGWRDHLAGMVRSVVFDEVQELRHSGTDKWDSAAHVAAAAGWRLGLSVGPESSVELIGGPFGQGWTGPIETATEMVAPLAFADDAVGAHTILRVEHLGIRSRGWTEGGFTWKPVRSFISHPLTSDMVVVATSSGSLRLTAEHAIYRVTDEGLVCERADAMVRGQCVAVDDGADWKAGAIEAAVDMVEVVADEPGAQVVVDLSGVDRRHLNMTAWQWQNSHREGKYGTRLPVATYRRFAHLLPEPTAVYRSLGRSGRRVDASLMLSEWAYILGFYLGDGWVEKTRVAFAVEKPLVPHIMKELRALSGADIEPTVCPGPAGSDQIRFSNPMVASLLRDVLGVSHKCHAKAIPGGWIASWPEAARRRLLAGLLDSDGHVSRKAGRRYYTTTSPALAQSLLALLRSLGILGSLSTRAPATGGTVAGRTIEGRRTGYIVNWSQHAESGANGGYSGRRVYHEWTRDRLTESKVRAVTPVVDDLPSMVYDLEMDGHPSFVANGVLVHNSATPVYNYGGEAHSIYEILAPGELGTRAEFMREWGSRTASNGQIIVAKPKALGEHLRDSGLLLARTRKDVGRELPAPIPIVQEIAADERAFDAVADEVAEMAKLIISRGGTRDERMKASGDMDWKLRQATGIAKAPYVAAFTEMLLQDQDAVVLFGWHRAVYEVWKHRLRHFNPLMYTGSESPKQKDDNAQRFINGESRLLIVSLRAGAGLDGLQTRTNTCVFGELDWSPAMHEQCTGRLARDGQLAAVSAYYLVSESGSDPVIQTVLNLKRQQSEPIMKPDAALFAPAADTGDRMRQLAQSFLDRHRTNQGIQGAA